jgi:hypothetical protein
MDIISSQIMSLMNEINKTPCSHPSNCLDQQLRALQKFAELMLAVAIFSSRTDIKLYYNE